MSEIKLPPLPDIPASICPWKRSEYIVRNLLETYARAAIEADRQTNKNLTHYMPEVIAALKATGCNESLVADIEKSMRGEYDRQARGEPVAWFEQGESGEWFLAYSHNQNAVTMPLYTTPQPQKIPEGYKLAPIKSTREMQRAGAQAARKYMQETGGNSPAVIYEAMLEVATQPEISDANRTV